MCTTMIELERAVADYRNLKVLLEETNEAVKAVEREIIGYLDFNKKVAEIGKDFSIKLSHCSRKTLDSKRLVEDLGDLSEYERVSNYTRLSVK